MRRLGMVLLGGVLITTLSGCGEDPDMYFEGKKQPQSQIEEIIEDRLEDENGLDLEVNISEEMEE